MFFPSKFASMDHPLHVYALCREEMGGTKHGLNGRDNLGANNPKY
jgi:hypothetical protein